jgi:hypothetical protein
MIVIIDFKESDADSICFLKNIFNKLQYLKVKLPNGKIRYAEYRNKTLIEVTKEQISRMEKISKVIIIDCTTSWKLIEKYLI